MATRVTLSPMGINCEPWTEIVKELDLHDLRQRFNDKKVIIIISSYARTDSLTIFPWFLDHSGRR